MEPTESVPDLYELAFMPGQFRCPDVVRIYMSSIKEVEAVYVEPDPRRGGFHVFTIVNERDPDVRGRIYEREQAIMDEYKYLEFYFRIIARRNRDLCDLLEYLRRRRK